VTAVGDVTVLPTDEAPPPCEGCRLRPGEVLVAAAGETFRVCVECAADGIRAERARVTGGSP
jgi:hypothetical protein